MKKDRYVTRKVRTIRTNCLIVNTNTGKTFTKEDCMILFKPYKKKETLLNAFSRKYSKHPMYVKDIEYPPTISIITCREDLESFIDSAEIISVENEPIKNNVKE